MAVYTNADSIFHPEVVERILVHFLDPSVGGVSGVVRSRKHNIITRMRELQVHLRTVGSERWVASVNAVPVIPGCIGAVRSELFDPALGYGHRGHGFHLLHIEKGYKIVYEMDSVTWTLDPPNLRSYVKQGGGGIQATSRTWSSTSHPPIRMKFQVTLSVADNSLFSILLLASILGWSMANAFPLNLLIVETLTWCLICLLYTSDAADERYTV
ncbi:MAG: hypothetical protein QI197_04570 [Candidatus Korarchaeota archaeon]|nr:hypothetical protein [Candidatus Korarchaeota archaeon]